MPYSPLTFQMLIRKPANEVFNAFIDPDKTKNFWFTSSSGSLKQGENITWTWGDYGVSQKIFVNKIIDNTQIDFTWPRPGKNVTITFQEHTLEGQQATYVVVLLRILKKLGRNFLK